MRRVALVIALLVPAVVAVGCAQPAADRHIDIVFDVCAPITVVAPEATTAQRTEIEHGLALWRDRGVSVLALDGPAAEPTVTIRFDRAAPAFHGVYEDEVGVIYLNDALASDPLAVTVAHELGHAFGLWHVDPAERPSVMNAGNVRIVPNVGDQQALDALWGPCMATPPKLGS